MVHISKQVTNTWKDWSKGAGLLISVGVFTGLAQMLGGGAAEMSKKIPKAIQSCLAVIATGGALQISWQLSQIAMVAREMLTCAHTISYSVCKTGGNMNRCIRQCADKLTHIETRQMKTAMAPRETQRQLWQYCHERVASGSSTHREKSWPEHKMYPPLKLANITTPPLKFAKITPLP